MIDLTPAAVAEIERLKLNQQTAASFLRLKVKSGGCLKLFYELTLESQAAPEDRQLEIKGIALVVDSQSWEYVRELQLDYAEDLMGGGFRFHNPQSKNTCGCGISFTPSAA